MSSTKNNNIKSTQTTQVPDSQLLKFAEKYVALGFKVLPVNGIKRERSALSCRCKKNSCPAPGKHPISYLVPNGVKSASNDSTMVRQWFTSHATSNIAVATGSASGIIALDVDPRNGGDKALRELEAQYGELPRTLRWCTGGGGEHIIFKNPAGSLKSSTSKVGSGLDIKSEGGYIVVPPSMHISGGYYHFAKGQSIETPIVEAPLWLLNLARGKSQHGTGTHLGRPANKVISGQVPEGQRNNTIASLAGHLLARKVTPRICLNLMLAFNEARCKPPLPTDEVVRTVLSIDRLAFSNISQAR